MSIHEPPGTAFGAGFPPSPFVPHRFSVEQYEQMIAAGILTEDDRVQLLEGVITEMSPIGPHHIFSVQKLMRALIRLLPEGWEVYVQQPVRAGTSAPQPDLTVIRGTCDDYQDRLVEPHEVGLLIEVADSSLSIDRIHKSRIYAAAGIPEYWIINLEDRCVECRRDPRPVGAGAERAYQPCEIIPANGTLKLVLDGQNLGEIPVASILPRQNT